MCRQVSKLFRICVAQVLRYRISAQSRVTLSSSDECTAVGCVALCGLSVIISVLCRVDCCLRVKLFCDGSLLF